MCLDFQFPRIEKQYIRIFKSSVHIGVGPGNSVKILDDKEFPIGGDPWKCGFCLTKQSKIQTWSFQTPRKSYGIWVSNTEGSAHLRIP